MGPTILDPAGWEMIGSIITRLAVFVVLMILGAFSLLLSRGIIPSLLATHHTDQPFAGHRQVLTVVGLGAFALALFQLARIVGATVALLQAFYPRFGF